MVPAKDVQLVHTVQKKNYATLQIKPDLQFSLF